MSVKNLDKHNRWRSKTVAFRLSPEEADMLNSFVRISGLSKQDYLCARCLQKEITVIGNPRVYKALKTELDTVLTELKRIEAGKNMDEDLLAITEQINKTLYGFGEE